MPSRTSSHSAATQAQQPITPELRRWIVAQAQAGFTAPALLKSMTDSGWNEDVAIDALEVVLREHLHTVTVQSGLPEASPVPEPLLEESPLFIDVGDRQVEVLLEVATPRIVLFGNLLSREECETLIDAAKPRMARSKTVETKTGGEEVNASRTSEGMFFQRGEIEIVKKLEARIAKLVNWPLENGEGLQILRYGPGAEYKPHYDYFDPAEPGTATITKRGGQRVGTLVVYLNSPIKGGGTVFPDIHLEVGPRQGNAVFFSYDRPHASTKTLHGGSPVIEGEKWIATKWLRQGEFV
ncbi:2-oxoglutarate-dependent dioxygenase [Diaphorobacter sp. HDW4A]|uniref:2OG-Fe(II) oxygenase n=1 Tax=Diaphorobacter sp. HDW4A TaxID=2714924 RepID=UPI00140E8291|nr:2OG-Fe(II) oxygenase [Diaphorobacter sp. HDW4A]QIL78668.1 2-oxoglutarate-dependent dioxygenase [Diaphorobacter sp. HDW4A]